MSKLCGELSPSPFHGTTLIGHMPSPAAQVNKNATSPACITAIPLP